MLSSKIVSSFRSVKTGGSFTALTVMINSPWSSKSPSETFTVTKISPFQFSSGVIVKCEPSIVTNEFPSMFAVNIKFSESGSEADNSTS